MNLEKVMLFRTLIKRLPEPLKEKIPSNSRVRKIFRKWKYEHPVKITLSLDGKSWKMLAPSKHPWNWTEYPEKVGCHEPITTRTILDETSKETVFWDVGAYIGYFPVAAIKLTDIPPSNVHVFEPDLLNAFLTRENIQRTTADSQIKINKVKLGKSNTGEKTCGDDYMEKNGCPDLIKIDAVTPPKGVEGAILSGMEEILQECKPVLLVEVHFFASNHPSPLKSVQQSLSGRGYTFEICFNHYDPDAVWSPIPSLDELPPAPAPGMNDYLLYCHF